MELQTILLWNIMEYYGILWNIMEYYGIPLANKRFSTKFKIFRYFTYLFSDRSIFAPETTQKWQNFRYASKIVGISQRDRDIPVKISYPRDKRLSQLGWDILLNSSSYINGNDNIP